MGVLSDVALAGGSFGAILLWDAVTGQRKVLLTGQGRMLILWHFHRMVAPFGGMYKEIQLWDVSTGQQKASLRHSNVVETVAFSPDGSTLASGSGDRTICGMLVPANKRQLQGIRQRSVPWRFHRMVAASKLGWYHSIVEC